MHAFQSSIAPLPDSMHYPSPWYRSSFVAEIQLLKFGQLVDLEVVDRALQRKGDEDVREEVRKQERQLRSEAALLDKQLEAKQEELAEVRAKRGVANAAFRFVP